MRCLLVPGLFLCTAVIHRKNLMRCAVAINHKDGSQLQVVYNDTVFGPVYLTDVFGNSKSWIEKRIQELTKRWVDPGIGQVHPS
jgi:high-affinity K+ transport system ATPase subunit B